MAVAATMDACSSRIVDSASAAAAAGGRMVVGMGNQEDDGARKYRGVCYVHSIPSPSTIHHHPFPLLPLFQSPTHIPLPLPQASVEDLDPPPALSCHPSDRISAALLHAYERDYTHLTVVSHDTRALLGYLNIPRLKSLLRAGAVAEEDPVDRAMQRFRRRREDRVYWVITMETPLEELEGFFDGRGGSRGEGKRDGEGEGEGEGKREKQDFAVVTDAARRFVLGVVTRADLEEFVKRRPA